jgi:hypothetical protein
MIRIQFSSDQDRVEGNFLLATQSIVRRLRGQVFEVEERDLKLLDDHQIRYTVRETRQAPSPHWSLILTFPWAAADGFARWLEANPAYQVERRRATRKKPAHETSIALGGLGFALAMVGVVAAIAFSQEAATRGTILIAHAATGGFILAVAIGVILNAAEERPTAWTDQLRLTTLRPHQVILAKILGWLIPRPSAIKRAMNGLVEGIAIAVLIAVGSQPSWESLFFSGLWFLGVPLGLLLVGGLAALEGGVIGLACIWCCSRVLDALMASILWIACLVLLPVFCSAALVAGLLPLPAWSWIPATVLLHVLSTAAGWRAAAGVLEPG